MNQSTIMQANMTVDPEFIFFKKCDDPNLEPIVFKLKNTTAHQIAWKVKMTTPKRYKMEPKRGVIPPLETAEVQVKMRYLKYPPNMPGNEKRERDSNGVFFDRYQFESVVVHGETITAANLRDKNWWTKQFKGGDVSIFKSKVFFTLNDSFPQSDIDALLEHPTHGSGEHSFSSSGFLDSSLILSQTEDKNMSSSTINSHPTQDAKIIEQAKPEAPVTSTPNSPIQIPKNSSTQIEQPVIQESKKIEQPVIHEPKKIEQPVIQESKKIEQSNVVSESKLETPVTSTPNSPVQPLKNSSTQIPQQPILRPPEKQVNSQINNTSLTQKTESTDTTSTSSSIQPVGNSTQPHIKELTRKTTQHPSSALKADSPVPKLICQQLQTLVWNYMGFILAFLLGYLIRWYFPF